MGPGALPLLPYRHAPAKTPAAGLLLSRSEASCRIGDSAAAYQQQSCHTVWVRGPAQGVETFQHELTSLRKAFVFDEWQGGCPHAPEVAVHVHGARWMA